MLISFIVLIPTFSFAVYYIDSPETESDSLQIFGEDRKGSQFFRDRYLHNNFVHYLDNYNDVVTYQAETEGDFQLPDNTVFSISGNSYRWNKFYINNFRIDSRYFAGSSLYSFDLNNHSLNIDSYNSGIRFSTDKVIPNSIALRYNLGGIGGLAPYVENMVNLFHKTALQRIYLPEEFRQKMLDSRRMMKGAGTVFLDFNVPVNEKLLHQQLYVDYGTRMLVGFNYKGIDNYYPEDFMKIEMNGELPFRLGGLFDGTNYLCSYSSRENLFTELNLSKSESAKKGAFNFSFYGVKNSSKASYTSGLTLATNKIQHNEPGFSRNIIDQDGEAFEPWYPDANILELSHAFAFTKHLTPLIDFNVDTYNSLINFKPSQNTFNNTSFVENVNLPYQSLYRYEWNSNRFYSGLLENVFQLNSRKQLSRSILMQANIDFTFDGMLIADKSMVRANWQGQLDFLFTPFNWFSMELNIGKKRVAFNYDHIRYLSYDYLSGELYSWNDSNSDRQFQEGEKSDYFTSTGGKYHHVADDLKQQAYLILDFPVKFTFGKHEVIFLNTCKKYNNMWTTRFDKSANDYGYYLPEGDNEIYFFNPGSVSYVVDYYPEDVMTSEASSNLFTNSPYFISSTIKYQFTSKKFFFSFAWSSYLMAGISSMGNGPLHNNIDVYSETTANPNNKFDLIGRLDQDRAYTARILFSYQMDRHFKFALSGKFKDGQPFTDFNTKIVHNANGNSQLAIWNNRTKGINPFTGEFGSRDDAFFNVEFRTSYSGKINNKAFELLLMMYNVYDFGTELVEYSFQPDDLKNRYPLELNIPRGLMITGKYYF